MSAETRRSPWFVELPLAAAVGAALLWLAGVLVEPAAEPFPGHGVDFAAMASRPIALDGPFPQRVLWPLGAFVAGRFGIGPVGFSQLASGFLIAVVCWFARARGASLVDAVLVAACVALSGAVLVYQPMACFSDPLSLALLLLLVHFAARPRVFWPLVFTSALSHELVFFFAPWLVYLRCRNGGTVRRETLLLVATLAAYLLVRLPMHAQYGIGYYLEKNFWVPWGLPAMWALWAMLVLVEFGPLLAVLLWGAGSGVLSRVDALGGRFGGWLYLLGLLPLTVLAYDVMRFAAFVHVPLVLALLAFVRTKGGRILLAGLLLAQCGSYLWLHPDPSAQGGSWFTTISGEILGRIGLLATRDPIDAVVFSWQLLGASWHIAVAALCFAAVLAALGIWLLRHPMSVPNPVHSSPLEAPRQPPPGSGAR